MYESADPLFWPADTAKDEYVKSCERAGAMIAAYGPEHDGSIEAIAHQEEMGRVWDRALSDLAMTIRYRP